MRNLLGRLLDRTPESLGSIARFWEVDLRGRDLHQDVGQLYRVMTDPWAYAIVWQRLGAIEQSVVRLLASEAGTFTADEIAARLATPVADVLPSLRGLYRAGFLYHDRPEPEAEEPAPLRFFLPRELAYLTKRIEAEIASGLADTCTAAELVDRLDDVELAEVAQHFGYRVIPAVALRPDLVAFVAPRLSDPDLIRDAVRGLDPTAARLWAWLREQAGQAEPGEALAVLGTSARQFRQVTNALARRGLLWRGYRPDGRLTLVIPDIVLYPQRAPAPPPPPLVEAPETSVEIPDWVPVQAAAWDLLTLLRALEDDEPPWRRGGDEASPAAVRRLAPRLWRRGGDLPPTGYIPFLAYLARALGLVGIDDRPAVTDRLRSWTRFTFAEETGKLCDMWRESAEWQEGLSREALQVWGADWPGFRKRLLAALRGVEGGGWYTLESFTTRFAALNPAALGPHFTAAASHEPSADSPEARRQAVIRLAAEITLTTACAWLGIVEVTRVHRLGAALRVPPEAAWLLADDAGAPEEGRVADSGRVTNAGQVSDSRQSSNTGRVSNPPLLGAHTLAVQPTFEVLLLRPAPRHVWALSAFADLERLDRVSIYHLRREDLERGLAGGLTLGRVTEYLEQQSGEPLPQNVAYQLAEWAREYRRVRLRRVLVVEPDDRASVAGIEKELREAGIRVERLDDGRLMVPLVSNDDSEMAARIEEILRRHGETPQWPVGR